MPAQRLPLCVMLEQRLALRLMPEQLLAQRAMPAQCLALRAMPAQRLALRTMIGSITRTRPRDEEPPRSRRGGARARARLVARS
jgi:hypothetical protein